VTASARRLRDVSVASVALTIAGPLAAAGGLLAWLEDHGPVLYRSQRIGKDGEPFDLLKLRTMRIDAHLFKVDTTSADDPRITRVGRFLRRTKLDEVPQFVNVMRGEMGLVGPRPNVAREVALYDADERRLLTMRPGVTDLASVALSDLAELVAGLGEPNEAYRVHIRPNKTKLGLYYVDNQGGLLDALALLLTVVAVFSPVTARRWLISAARRFEADTQVMTALDSIAALADRTPVS